MKEELGLPCPYKVNLDHAKNSYSFTTDSGAEYEVLFEEQPDLFIGTHLEGFETFDLILNKIKGGTGGEDPNILKTVEAIIQHFFSNNNRILVYTCDSTDAKEATRHRLFKKWYSKSGLKKEIKRIQYDIKDGNIIYHSTVLYHHLIQIDRTTINNSVEEVVNILDSEK